MHSDITGVLVKIAYIDDVDLFLKKGSSERPAARFNRVGQDALYLSRDEQSARVALQKYVTRSDPPRVLIRYNVEPCRLVDLRHDDASDLRRLSSQNWQDALANNLEPNSWQVADKLRNSHEVGMIDQSRKQPDLWHVILFRWNETNAPKVTMIGNPTPIAF